MKEMYDLKRNSVHTNFFYQEHLQDACADLCVDRLILMPSRKNSLS